MKVVQLNSKWVTFNDIESTVYKSTCRIFTCTTELTLILLNDYVDNDFLLYELPNSESQ